MTPVTATGNVAAIIGDSIMAGFGTGYAGSQSFIPMWRKATGAPTPNVAMIGAGGVTLSSDFNSEPTPAIITGQRCAGGRLSYSSSDIFAAMAQLVPIETGGSVASITMAVKQRMSNDYAHLNSVYGNTSNRIGIAAASLKKSNYGAEGSILLLLST